MFTYQVLLGLGPDKDLDTPIAPSSGALRLVEDFTAGSRAEPGTISFEWSCSMDDPKVYFLVEAFRDAGAAQAQVGSDHFKAAVARMPGLLAGVPEIVHADLQVGWVVPDGGTAAHRPVTACRAAASLPANWREDVNHD